VIPSQARVVIVGGGIIGASVAYHLTRLGWRDVALLEQGSVWAAGGDGNTIFEVDARKLAACTHAVVAPVGA